MFPIAFPPGNIDDRTPKADDGAGLGEIYATSAFNRQFGQINGRVTLNGAGIFGAHVTALNTATGALIAGFCLTNDGRFVISGLPAGVYVLRAEPLDDGDLDSFFDSHTVVETNFTPAFSSRVVPVPAGGAVSGIEIKVASK